MIGERAIAGRLGAGKEHLAERVAAGRGGQQPRLPVDLDEDEVRRDFEVRGREVDDAVGLGLLLGVIDHPAEEILPDGQGRGRAGLPLPQRDGQVVADPDAGAEVGREADEPGVRVLVGRPGLAGQRPAEDRGRGRRAALALDDAPHKVGHHVGGLGRKDFLRLDAGFLQDVAVLVLDLGDEIGLEADPLAGERGEGRDHLHQRDLEGPQAEREVGVERRRDAEPPAVVDADLRRDEIEELGGDDVARLLEPHPQGDGALVFPVVVLGRPGLVVPAVDERDRLVGDDAGRGEAVLDRGGIEKGLDRRAGLARRLDGPVELAVAEGVASDQSLDLARLGVDGDESAVPQRLLGQGDDGLVLGRVEGHDPDLDDIALAEEGVEAAGLGPIDVLGRHTPDPVLEPDRGLGARDREGDGVIDLAGLDGLALPGQKPLALEGGLGGRDQVFEGLGGGVEEVRLVGPPAVQDVLGRTEPRLQGLLGVALQRRVEGRVDLEPVVVEPFDAVVLFEVAADLLEEIGAEFLGRPPQREDGHRPSLGRLALGLAEVTFGDHPVEDVVAAVERARLVLIGGVSGRALEDAGDHGRFLEVEVGDVLAEKEVGGRLDAVGSVTQEEVIAVELEDLFLGVELLDLAREVELLKLAPQADLAVEEERAGHLLGDRAPAFGTAAAEDLEDIGPDGPQDAADVDTAVLEEARILRGDDGVDEVLRQPVEGDFDALLLGELLDLRARDVVNGRDELGPEIVDVADVRQVVLDGDVDA